MRSRTSRHPPREEANVGTPRVRITETAGRGVANRLGLLVPVKPLSTL